VILEDDVVNDRDLKLRRADRGNGESRVEIDLRSEILEETWEVELFEGFVNHCPIRRDDVHAPGRKLTAWVRTDDHGDPMPTGILSHRAQEI
jgi:hypothetical protein